MLTQKPLRSKFMKEFCPRCGLVTYKNNTKRQSNRNEIELMVLGERNNGGNGSENGNGRAKEITFIFWPCTNCIAVRAGSTS